MNQNQSATKVLIVDDNAGMRQMLRFMLPYFSGEVLECADGQEAINLYRRHRPSIVLMDIRLKSSDGITTTKNIKQSFPSANIVMVSSYGDERFRAAAKQAGATAYVLKDNLYDVVGLVQQRVA
ncbi:MAG: response regulator [Bacteroidetes bacterium]|nr:MAG: response regulator [Bacteroidota bacterium]